MTKLLLPLALVAGLSVSEDTRAQMCSASLQQEKITPTTNFFQFSPSGLVNINTITPASGPGGGLGWTGSGNISSVTNQSRLWTGAASTFFGEENVTQNMDRQLKDLNLGGNGAVVTISIKANDGANAGNGGPLNSSASEFRIIYAGQTYAVFKTALNTTTNVTVTASNGATVSQGSFPIAQTPTITITLPANIPNSGLFRLQFVSLDAPAGGAADDFTVYTVSAKACPTTVSGNVFNDNDGATGGVNGTAIGGAGSVTGQLYVNLVDASGKVVASAPVAANGSYTLSNYTSGNLTARLSTTPGTIGSAAPAASLPSGWSSVSETDGSANLNQPVTVADASTNTNLNGFNFGLNQPPTATADNLTGQTPGSAATLPNLLSNDTDPNGGTLSPANINLITPSGATAVQTAANGMVTGFTVPNQGIWSLNPGTGALTFTPQAGFTGDPTPVSYTVKDAAGLSSAPVAVTIDFNPPVTVSGTLYNDNDGTTGGVNGTALGGATVTLYAANGTTVIATTTTDANGNYSFPNQVPGNYVVGVTPPSGYQNVSSTDGTPTDGKTSVTVGNTAVPGINFGLNQPPTATADNLTGQTPGAAATIPNLLNNDTDPNGGTLSPANISLVTPSGATAVQTSANGMVTGFTVPNEGTWSLNTGTGALTFTPQAGFTGDPTPVSYTVKDAAGLTSTPSAVTIDFNPAVFLYGWIRNDNTPLDDNVNGYGINTAGAAPLYVYGLDANGVVIARSQVTTQSYAGRWSFFVPQNTFVNLQLSGENISIGQSLPANDRLPNGFLNTGEKVANTQSNGNDGTKDGKLQLGVVSASSDNNDFAIAAGATVRGWVRLDNTPGDNNVNGGGTNTAGGSPLYVYAVDANNKIIAKSPVITWGYDGRYNMELPVGASLALQLSGTDLPVGGTLPATTTLPNHYSYSGEQAGNTQNNGNDGTKDGRLSLGTLAAGSDGNDFSIAPAQTVSGTIYNDNDAGTPDGTPVFDTKVTLYAANGTTIIATTTTDAGGNYSFSDLAPGNYTIRASRPSDYRHVSSTDATPSNGRTSVTVGSAAVPGVNFGINQPPVSANDNLDNQALGSAVTIPNILDNDTDPNGGTLSPANIHLVPGYSGVDQEISANGMVIGFTRLYQGTWRLNTSTGALTFTPQAGFYGNPDSVSYTVKDAAGLTSASATVTINYALPAISGTVFNDNNGTTGGADGNAQPGTTMELYASNDTTTVIATTTTDASGNYSFLKPAPGNYTIRISRPSNFFNVSSTDDTPTDGRTTVVVGNTDISGLNFGINEPPVPKVDTLEQQPHGTSRTIPNLLSNDTDPNGGILSPANISLVAPSYARSIQRSANGMIIGFLDLYFGTWSLNPGTGALTFTPANFSITTYYRLDYTVTDAAGLTSPSSVLIGFLGMNEGEPIVALLNNEIRTGALSLYPNPATDKVTITGLDKDAPYTIYSSQGTLIRSGTLRAGKPEIATTDLATGTYLLNIIKDGETHPLKIVRQ